jgi:uncharacterized protein
MNYLKTICIISIFLLSSKAFAQDIHQDLILKYSEHPHKHYFFNELSFQNEPELIFSGLFVIYKTFISSQDQGNCNFIPSCSSYGLQSVRKKGILKGILNTFDRLSRCHGFSKTDYIFDQKTGLLIDEVD